jgi:outer membrane autotransporter protein
VSSITIPDDQIMIAVIAISIDQVVLDLIVQRLKSVMSCHSDCIKEISYAISKKYISNNSLRAHVGEEWQSTIQTDSGKTFSTSLQAAWHHELRDTEVHQTANFTGYANNRFGETNTVTTKDSLSVQAGLSYQLKEAMQLKAGLSATMWKGRDVQFAGSVSVNWKF